MIAIIDYGMGNLRSVQKALEFTESKTIVTSRPYDLSNCDKIVLPGVGAFGDAMRELKGLRLVGPIRNAIKDGKPFLGLCLGLQLLFDRSEEAPGAEGLGVLKGEVKRFNFSRLSTLDSRHTLKVPHMGWNEIRIKGEEVRGKGREVSILDGVPDGSYMYFVHSYYVVPRDKSICLTTTNYGINFVSGIRKGNIFGFQFHPEKSQRLGLQMLKNFVKL